jgi:hypothetical protein
VNERPKIDSDSLVKLPPAQLREMREAFQVLDRDNDGQVSRDDVADILRDLGTAMPGCPPRQSNVLTRSLFRPRFFAVCNLPILPSGEVTDT